MKLTSIKTAKETGIPGIEFVITDKAITEVIFGKLRIRKGESYSQSLQVLVETPFETDDRFRLTGKIAGFPDAVSYHDTKYDADSAGAKLEDAGATWSVELVKVTLDDDGNIVDAPAGAEVAPTPVDELAPF